MPAKLVFAAAIFIAAAFWILTSGEPECGLTTPRTFVVSISPYVCDFTRGAGPLVR